MRYLRPLGLALVAAAMLVACGGGEPGLARSVPTQVIAALKNPTSTQVDSGFCTASAIATGAYQWVGGQCTESSTLLATAGVTRALAATLPATTMLDAGALLDWAETKYPSLFPGRKVNLTVATFTYRYYPETQNALGVSEAKVYGLGPPTGNVLALLGNLSDFTCEVSPSACNLSAPGAPTIGAATAGSSIASVAFTAPSVTAGAAISSYSVTCKATGATLGTSATGSSSPIIVTGLTNGTSYSCSVTATNSAGSSAASATVSVTPVASNGTGASSSTAGVLCNIMQSIFNSTASVNATSTSSWTCSNTSRVMASNGLPDHAVGTFPNPNNPNTIKTQSAAATYTLTPAVVSSTGTAAQIVGYAVNGVKFDPGTGGACNDSGSTCSLIGGSGTWRIEALTQSAFNFGTDTSNAHVQPTGEYHYHGMPEGYISKLGKGTAMTLVGWAADGFPVYARFGYANPLDATSAVKVLKGSYRTKASPDANRPATTLYAMGTFMQDWEYVAGLGDLDQCNGRTGVTPEFPQGTYHYMITDTYPFIQRCVKGTAAGGGAPAAPPGGGTLPPPPRASGLIDSQTATAPL